MIAPQNTVYTRDRAQEALIALRGLLSRNPCAAQFDAATLAKLIYVEGYLSHPIDAYEVEVALEALMVEDEVLG